MARCGDGHQQEGEATTEACDDGNAIQTDECLNDCTTASCGDGFVHQGVEGCDDGNDVVTIITSFNALVNKPIATGSGCAIVETFIGLNGIPIVAGFGGCLALLLMAIPTTSQRAGVQAVIDVG